MDAPWSRRCVDVNRVQTPGQEEFTTRLDVVELVPRPIGRVLDVGCGPGLTGEALLRAGATEVWGIERDPDLAREAGTRLTRVLSVDLDRDSVGDLPRAYFDCLIYADVLEHLVDPWTMLRLQQPLLRPEGTAVISIPNVRNLRVVVPLLWRGRWDYTPSGIMSVGHLRFFTTRTMREMINGAGYRVVGQAGSYATKGRILRTLSLGLVDDLVVKQRLFVCTTIGQETSGLDGSP